MPLNKEKPKMLNAMANLYCINRESSNARSTNSDVKNNEKFKQQYVMNMKLAHNLQRRANIQWKI